MYVCVCVCMYVCVYVCMYHHRFVILMCDSHNCLPTDTRPVGTVTEQKCTQHLAVSLAYSISSPATLTATDISCPGQLHAAESRTTSNF